MDKKFLVLMLFLAQSIAGYDLDEMAVAACTGMSVGHGVAGHIIAVRRQCSNLAVDCTTTCKQATSFGGSKTFSCFDSLHVYKDRPDLGEGGEGKVR